MCLLVCLNDSNSSKAEIVRGTNSGSCIKVLRSIGLLARASASKSLAWTMPRNFIETAGRDRKARTAARADLRADLFHTAFEVEPGDLSPRRHQRSGGFIAEMEHGLNHILRLLLENSGPGSLLHQVFDFLLGHRRLLRLRLTEKAADQIG